jgi:dihydrofolate reductase
VNIPQELRNNVTVIKGDPMEIISLLKDLGFQNLYIDGGKTIQSFLEADLIDEMIITKIPILLGNGIPLFGKLSQKLQFTHKKTETFNDMLVKSHYSRNR